MLEIILYILILCYPFLLWKTFSDAGYSTWKAFIPVYNYIIWIKIIRKRFWWFLLWLIPFINIFMVLLMAVETAQCYSKYKFRELALSVFFPLIYFPYLELSKKEHFISPDKQKPHKKSVLRGWVDALIFAGGAAFIVRTFMIELYMIPTSSMEKSLMVGDYLFVNKMLYGAKIPKTVLAIPFIHNTLPLTETTNSYLEWISLPYYRFIGYDNIKRYDAVVFNYPTGDSVILEMKAKDYYKTIRSEGRNKIFKNYTVISRPVDKEENYVKRCVGIPGDTLVYENQTLYVNGKKLENPAGLQFMYYVQTKTGALLSKNRLERLNISTEDIRNYHQSGYIPLTLNEEEQIKKMSDISICERMHLHSEIADPDIFPFDTSLFHWNLDNFGPLFIPQEGATISLTKENIVLYKRIIEVYEHNSLQINENNILINGHEATTYTFKMNYYWMMGDNRHNSLDARYWGFVPEDHIVGKASLVLISLNKDKSLFNGKIRMDRLFKKAR